MQEVALAVGIGAVAMAVFLYVAAKRREEGRKEGYRKELAQEAEKYLPEKASVRIYSGIGDVIKSNPKLGDMPIAKFVTGMERYARESMKEGITELLHKGVKPEKVKDLAFEAGKFGAEKEAGGEKSADNTMAFYTPGKDSVTLRYIKGNPQESASLTAHEAIHGIVDRSPLGSYEKSLIKDAERGKETRSAEMSKYVDAKTKVDELQEQLKEAKGVRSLASWLGSARKEMEKSNERYSRVAEKEEKTEGNIAMVRAVNEALAYAVQTSLEGRKLSKKDLKAKDASYSAPISQFYQKTMSIIEKKGVKAAVESVRMINPDKAEKSKKFFKSFDDMYAKTMEKSS